MLTVEPTGAVLGATVHGVDVRAMDDAAGMTGAPRYAASSACASRIVYE